MTIDQLLEYVELIESIEFYENGNIKQVVFKSTLPQVVKEYLPIQVPQTQWIPCTEPTPPSVYKIWCSSLSNINDGVGIISGGSIVADPQQQSTFTVAA